MIQYDNVYDISVQLGIESIDYPNDTPYTRELIWTIQQSGVCDLSKLVMSAHSGTHIDVPAHFIPNAKTLDSYKVQDFILPAKVVEITDRVSITYAELRDVDVAAGDALLFKTHNSRSGLCKTGEFSENYVFLAPDAADFCVEKNVSLVGIDYITIEKFGDNGFPVHKKILGDNILVLEGINLSNIQPGQYTLVCLPLNIKEGEASPVRAVLMD